MSHIHVCLVSDHVIPNILSICHFKPDEVLLVTTDGMEKKEKSKAIVETLKYLDFAYSAEQMHKVKILEDSILDCQKKLETWITGKEDNDFTVNLTGGTKIMSISVFEFFKDYGSKMIYIPIPKNEFIKPFPKKLSSSITKLETRLSVKQYLSAYGVSILNENKLEGKKKMASEREELSRWIVKNYRSVKSLLERFSEKLRKYRNEKKGYEWHTEYKPNSYEKEFLAKLGFLNNNGDYSKKFTKDEIEYVTGGWLEEYCYNELNKFLGQGIDCIGIGVEVGKGGWKNEFDVMFTKDNALFTIECKSLDQNDDRSTGILYKIGALQKDFGLKVESFLVSTSAYILKDGEIRPSVKARAEQFNTTVIPPAEVADFQKKVMKKLKLNGA